MHEATFKLGACRGQRPWLGRHAREECGEESRLLIRTASNAWFPQVVSVLSLPERASEVEQAVEELWDRLQIVKDVGGLGFVKGYPEVANRLAPFSDEEVLGAISSRSSGGAAGERPIKHVELDALLAVPEGFGEEAILEVLGEWGRLGASADAEVAWLKSLRLSTARAPAPDFVWTGPDVAGLNARDTRRVYEELLGSATRSIWASTYVFSDGPRAFRTLAHRMDVVPALEVNLMLNIERRRGDTTAADTLVRRFADDSWGEEWPGAARPKVYYDPRSVESGGPAGVLHAKAVVADEASVFITSANLTAAAQDRNIELGLLVRDRALAETTVIRFRTLIEKDLLRRLPDA